MKPGNVTGIVYDRSVYRKMNSPGKETGSGAVRGEDCAVLSFDIPCTAGPEEGRAAAAQSERAAGAASVQAEASAKTAAVRSERFVKVAAAQTQAVYSGEGCGKYAVFAAVNQAACAGAVSGLNVLAHILLPAGEQEHTLRRIVEDAQEAAESLGVSLADVKAIVTAAVNRPVVTAAAMGPLGQGVSKLESAVGEEIVMTKWAGLEGSAMLARRCAGKLRERYPSALIREAAEFDRFLSVVPEAAAAVKSGVSVCCAAAEGGIFRALWTLGQRGKTGLEVDLKKIPIRQETVEICNYLDLNPYELAANGSLLCVTEHGEALVRSLDQMGVPAAVIGTLTAGNDRVIVNGEERRFLEPAKADEIYKFL